MTLELHMQHEGGSRRSLRRTLLGGLGGGLLFGSWAAAANWSHGTTTALVSAAGQGGISFVASCFLFSLVELGFGLLWPRAGAAVACALGVPTVASILMALVHWSIGTPEILLTIAPSVSIAFPACAVYAYGLDRSARARRGS